MKRVLLLVCLIVSLAELDLERARVFLFSSLASLLLVVWSEWMGRREVQNAAPVGALTPGEGISSVACVLYSQDPQQHAGHIEGVEPNAVAKER
jgi:hypothetical protein